MLLVCTDSGQTDAFDKGVDPHENIVLVVIGRVPSCLFIHYSTVDINQCRKDVLLQEAKAWGAE